MSAQDENQTDTDNTDAPSAEELAELREKAAKFDRTAEALNKRIKAIEDRAKNRPPDASDIKAMMGEALGIRSDAIDEKQGARGAADKAEEVANALGDQLADVQRQLRRRDIVDAAAAAGAHNPDTIADITIGRDGEPAEVVAALRESEKWMFKAGTDPEAGQGKRYQSKDPGMRELEAIIAESRK